MNKKNTIKNKINQLKDIIYKHDHFYYNLDQPKISDYEYDQIFESLVKLEKQYPELLSKDSPTQRVPGQPLSHFTKKQHPTNMLSLQNTYNTEEISTFYNKTLSFFKSTCVEFLLEPKFDGVAINLIYENGLLTKALTRGNGKTGENVLENIKTIKSIPLKLPVLNKLLEIRGEIVLFKNDFKQINKQQEEQGLSNFANPRNMAAGSLRQLDPKVTSLRPLKFFAHSKGLLENMDLKTQDKFLTTLKTWGLPVLPVMDFASFNIKQKKTPFASCVICNNKQDILNYFHTIEQLRHKLMFEIDGIVIKVNQFSEQQKMGFISRSPRWARATKFEPQKAQTYITDISIQIGRTGVLTPVAILKPVQVGGVTITNASLYNASEISKKDIRIGDEVTVGRAGDVIPEVIKVNLSKRKPTSVAFKMPLNCTACLSKVQIIRNIYFCINPLCPSIRLQALIHFASKKAMNIEFLGNKMIEQLYKKKLIQTFSDIYKISESLLLNLDRQGEKSNNRILLSIQKSKKTTLPAFIFSLGIRHIGEQTAHNLSTFFMNKASTGEKQNWPLPLILISQAEEEELKQIPDIGETVSYSIHNTFKQESFINEINLLFTQGVEIILPSKNNINNIFEKKQFVITGSFPQSRSQLEKQIRLLGGQIKNTINKDTDFLLTGLNTKKDSSQKTNKAYELNITCLNWEEFTKMTNKNPAS